VYCGVDGFTAPEIREITKIQEKWRTKTNIKIVETCKVSRPDGTVETSTRETVGVADTETVAAVQTYTEIKSLARYRVTTGVLNLHEWDPKHIKLGVGIRLGNLPLWLEGGIHGDFKTYWIGIGWEF